jgi:hypothetical protein
MEFQTLGILFSLAKWYVLERPITKYILFFSSLGGGGRGAGGGGGGGGGGGLLYFILICQFKTPILWSS